MTDLSLPPLDALPTPAGSGFAWPAPPSPAFASVQPRLPAECTIEGTTGRTIRGQLTAFDPAQRTACVRIGSGRQTMPFAFAQIQQLTLTAPLQPARSDDAHPVAQRYRLLTAMGQARCGETVGHVETDAGLFLFVPHGDHGAVQPVFVPQGRYSGFALDAPPDTAAAPGTACSTPPVEAELRLDAPPEPKTPPPTMARPPADVLLAKKVASADELIAAIDHQARMPVMRIGEALLGLGLITEEQLDEALAQQKLDRSVPLGQLLVRNGIVSRQDLQTALARKMGYPVVDVAAFPVEIEAARCVPFAVAHRLNALPLLRRGSRLIVAMDDPTVRPALEELEFVSQCKIVPALAPASDIARALPPIYERFGMDARHADTAVAHLGAPIEFEPPDANQLLASLEQQQLPAAERDDEPAIEQSDNSLVKLVNTMIVDAWMQRVSDIHIETQPGREKVRIRFRRDGVLKPYLELPHTYRAALVARIKIMCDLDISERRKPQDGKINFARFSPQHKIELRVATIPTANGLEDVVMRILASAKPLPIDQLGLSADNLARLRHAIHRPYGMVLCVGPTGSGKTTTLHSALGEINTPDRKIWTAEDPIEITQHGLRQVQVNPKIDWTFAKALRAFLRADPDVIMVGEIRDEETAHVAIEASLTGHLVLSTLHTNSAPETVTRLLDMGMDPFNFGDSLLAVLAQRLVRRLCPHCRTARDATDAEVDDLLGDHLHVFPEALCPSRDAVLADWRARFGEDGRIQFYESPGCPRCDGSGFDGRVGIHELLTVTRPLRQLIVGGGRVEQLLDQALADGMRTLRQDGIEKVLQGLTTIGEVRATSNV
ncbi:GspE/PulE family protein [Azohydromonas sediminis]|uniref:GspE/PulE family protein n=1 Tax=Azohydromonas sediminis TaxID=2259674 RepID=UPI001B35679F|nr:ATPase, T2SS/T4P/T4SS family [Azohydromonas sediminis]